MPLPLYDGPKSPTDSELAYTELGEWEDEWKEILDDKGKVLGISTKKIINLEECTADPHSKVYKKIYKKYHNPYDPTSNPLSDSMPLPKPIYMAKPVPEKCACQDCQNQYAEQLQAYSDYLDDVQYYKQSVENAKVQELKDEVQQKLAEKKKIALQYLEEQENKKPKVGSGGNPLLIVKATDPWLEAQKTIYQKSTPGSSHDKGGEYGGTSSYTDSDVAQARYYMQTVLGVDKMSVNGRSLDHILAEVYGFSSRNAEATIRTLKSKMKNQDNQDSVIEQLKKTVRDLTVELEEATIALKTAEKAVGVQKKMDKETVAATSTGRRIKE